MLMKKSTPVSRRELLVYIINGDIVTVRVMLILMYFLKQALLSMIL